MMINAIWEVFHEHGVMWESGRNIKDILVFQKHDLEITQKVHPVSQLFDRVSRPPSYMERASWTSSFSRQKLYERSNNQK